MIPLSGTTSPQINMMLLEKSSKVTTASMSFSMECGDTRVVCGRRGHTLRGTWSTGKVVGSKLSGNANELNLTLVQKAEYYSHVFLGSLMLSPLSV